MASTAMFEISECVLVDTCITAPAQYVFLAHSEASLRNEQPVCELIAYRDGRWVPMAAWSWEAVALASVGKNWIVLGRDGQIGETAHDASSEWQIDPDSALGPFRGMRRLGENVYAYGMKREVFLRRGRGHWVRLMDGFEPPSDGRELTLAEEMKLRRRNLGGINAMALGPAGELTAVGMKGEIWTHDGRLWSRVDSPTNLMLKDLTLGGDGQLHACGLSGTLLAGSAGRWAVISYEGTQELDFCSIAWFDGILYVADGHSLRRLDGNLLELVDHAADNIVPCVRVVASEQRMLSIAGQEVWETSDGKFWKCLLG
jgi:hypothetical protein